MDQQAPQRRANWPVYPGGLTLLFVAGWVSVRLGWLSGADANAVWIALGGVTLIALTAWVLIFRRGGQAPERPPPTFGLVSVLLYLCSLTILGLFLWARSRGLGPVGPVRDWPGAADLNAMGFVVLESAMMAAGVWDRLDAERRRKVAPRQPPLVLGG